MVVNDRPLKRARRNRETADLYDILKYPAAGDTFSGEASFRYSVKAFLSRHAGVVTFPSSLFPSLLTWQVLFRVGDLVEGPENSPMVVAFDIFEVDVMRSTRSFYCNQCRVVGWSGHPVCRKRYHFIIRANNGAMEGYWKSCTKCGNTVHFQEFKCKWCGFVLSMDDLEEWIYSQFEDNTHLLHGVVHSNGFGHLLTLNGRESGSVALSGCEIMDFWDRLCTALFVRKVSVMDVSRKYGVEYRLLRSVTEGNSWYGDWGYEFGRGSYALTSDDYKKATEILSNIPLEPLLFQGRRSRTCLQSVIAFYRSLSESELLTVKDLFCFLLRLIHGCKKPSLSKVTPVNLESSISKILCAWTRDDVERVQQAMIKVLAAVSGKNNWVTRHSLKAAMSKIASPELLNYCLKHLGGKLTANSMLVRARCNPNCGDAEFRLVPLSSARYEDGLDANHPSKEQMKNDLKFLFDSLLHPETMSYRCQLTRKSMIDLATKLLDCKQFVKDFKPDWRLPNNPSAIRLWCHVELSEPCKQDQAIPPELIVLPSHATIADLKSEAAKAFEEVYAMFKRFEIDKLVEYGSLEDSFTLKFLFGINASIRIKVASLSKHALSQFGKERGTESWTVDCLCGTKDDDGERMLACDVCGVWQHTRCAGIKNPDAILTKFVCSKCVNSYCNKFEWISQGVLANKVSAS